MRKRKDNSKYLMNPLKEEKKKREKIQVLLKHQHIMFSASSLAHSEAPVNEYYRKAAERKLKAAILIVLLLSI